MLKMLFYQTVLSSLRVLVDKIIKIKDYLNPLLYSENLRVTQCYEGVASYKSGRAAIFVVYRKEGVPFYIKNILAQLKRLEVDCWVTVNQNASTEIIDYLRSNSHKVIVRKSFGRDFGAYKDVIAKLNLKELQRLLIINDSVFYFSKNLDILFNRLFETQQEVLALTCSGEQHWHAQSYLLSLSRNVFLSSAFSHFWRNYKPFNSRSHAIKYGELGFSKAVLFRYSEISPAIYNRLVASLSLRNDTQNIFHFLIPDYWKSDETSRDNMSKYNARLLRSLEDFNPSHGIALLCALSLGFCVLKRDVSFRKTFAITSIAEALYMLDIDKSEIEEAITELEVKGKVDGFGLLVKLKAILGLI
jgi:hypothetical protein